MKHANRCRIVAGKWRSRLLNFPATKALRPTPDAVRETLFNWLTPHLQGARCLDLFAGSGALGFEAISRGAAQAVLVEKHPRVAKALRDNQQQLDDDGQIQVVNCPAMAYLSTATPSFDLVFLDPPYASDELLRACNQLDKRGLLAAGAWVYIEAPQQEAERNLPASWVVQKTATRGAVCFSLWQNQARTSSK